MKNEHEIEADRLIEQYKNKLEGDVCETWILDQSTQCALNDVENTIKVLEEIPDFKVVGNVLLDKIDFQTKVRDILKNKLK